MTDKHALELAVGDKAHLEVKVVDEQSIHGTEMAVIEVPVQVEGSVTRLMVPAVKLEKIAALILLLLMVGCNLGQQAITYNSIAAAEQVASSANIAFLSAVVSGQASTNNVPAVEKAFDLTQQSLHAAALVAVAGTKAPVPVQVANQVTTFTNLALTSIHH